MRFLGPVQVFYDGPPQLEGYYVSLARTGLGFLEAQRLGYVEAPISNTLPLPGGGSIQITLLGTHGVAHIQVPAEHTGRRVRRFKRKEQLVLCMYPTGEPIALDVAEKDGVLEVKQSVYSSGETAAVVDWTEALLVQMPLDRSGGWPVNKIQVGGRAGIGPVVWGYAVGFPTLKRIAVARYEMRPVAYGVVDGAFTSLHAFGKEWDFNAGSGGGADEREVY